MSHRVASRVRSFDPEFGSVVGVAWDSGHLSCWVPSPESFLINRLENLEERQARPLL